jgi:putative ABC transport system ATP-binding protein
LSGAALYELEGVGRAFRQGDRRVEALEGVDLRIEAGEHVSVTGPSGSGKTTLLQLLGALDRPTAGRIALDGRELGALRERDLTELRLRGVGFVFQQFNLMPTLTARGNVEAALAPLGLPRRQRRQRALERLAEVGLGDRAGHLPAELSGGEQQRVAIARALACDPRVILADEPTGSLDRAASEGIADILGALAGESGRTVVIVTHNPEVAARAPRIVQLADGRVLRDGPGDRVSALHAVEIPVPDPAAAREWYARIVGLPAGDAVRFVEGASGDGRIWLEVADVQHAIARVRAAGIEVDGDHFADPWGNRLGLARGSG